MSDSKAQTSPLGDQRVERIFEEAVGASSAERAGVLDRLCGGDIALRAEVESLLAHAQRTRDFLESPLLPGGGTLEVPLPETIGPFKVIGLLGEGGMGCVYEAQQERPRRLVAIKMIRPDALTPGALRRFDREIQTLGQLRHPCIAQLYEVGQQVSSLAGVMGGVGGMGGRAVPYLVMELVRGAPLTKFAAAEKLSVRERVELLAQIADAVQYAHQRGVVHRDLKPENIFVERGEDGNPRPKILDFGIARLTEEATEATQQTIAGQPMGTLAYMSPEQFAADPAAIDTRCDVYALGVIAYELFAGARPFDVTGLSVVQAARMIEGQEPPRLGTVDKALRGDIETIVAKAMAKDREARYASASAMAEDLRRHLRDEPILARPPSAWYQISKFARRNRVLVGVASAGVAALIAGLVVSTSLYLGEQKERKRAADAAALSEGVRDYMISGLLLSASPKRRGYDVKMMEVLTTAADGLHERFKDHPEVEAAVRMDLGSVLGELGKYKESEEQLRLAAELLERIEGPDSPQTLLAMNSRSNSLQGMGRLSEALELSEETLKRARRSGQGEKERGISARNNLGAALHRLGRYDESEAMLKEGLALARADPQAYSRVATTILSQLAAIARARKDNDAYLDYTMQMVELARRDEGEQGELVVVSCSNLIYGLLTAGRTSEAADFAARLPAMADKTLPPDHVSRGLAYISSANGLLAAKRYEEAEKLALSGCEILAKSAGDTDFMTEQSMEVPRKLYAQWPNHGDELKTWCLRQFRCRIMKATRKDLGETMKQLQNMSNQCVRAGANMSHGGLQEALWTRRDELAPPGHPRRAMYFANYALLCDAIEDCNHAQEALAIAQESLKDMTEDRSDAEALIALGKKRFGKSE